MVSRTELEMQYACLPDEALLDILRDAGGYTPLALEVAILEIHRRGLTPDHLQARQTEQQQQEAWLRYFEPLSTVQMVLIYLFSPAALVVLGIFIFLRFSSHLHRPDAQLLKRKQAGLLVFISITLLLATYLLSLLMDSTYPLLLWAAAAAPATREVRKARITQEVVEVEKPEDTPTEDLLTSEDEREGA